VGQVKAFLKGGKAAPKLQSLLPTMQLLGWCDKHTGYRGVRSALVSSGLAF